MFWSNEWTFDKLPDLTGRVAIVTGGNTGIGKSICRVLSQHGVKVYLAARTPTKALSAIDDIKSVVPKADIHFLQLDLLSFEAVKDAAASFKSREKRLDILVNNAGMINTSYEETSYGIEAQFQTNYLSPFLFTRELLPVLQETAKKQPEGTVRIVNVSSNGHNFAPTGGISFDDYNLKSFSVLRRYGHSKLGNILHAKALAKRYPDIITTSNHPGAVRTELTRGLKENYPWIYTLTLPINMSLQYLFFRSPDSGATTSLYLAASPEVTKNRSGEYYVPIGKLTKPSSEALKPEMPDKLWDWTEEFFTSRNI